MIWLELQFDFIFQRQSWKQWNSLWFFWGLPPSLMHNSILTLWLVDPESSTCCKFRGISKSCKLTKFVLCRFITKLFPNCSRVRNIPCPKWICGCPNFASQWKSCYKFTTLVGTLSAGLLQTRSIAISGVGTGGSSADHGGLRFPGVPYGPNDFNPRCQPTSWTTSSIWVLPDSALTQWSTCELNA